VFEDLFQWVVPARAVGQGDLGLARVRSVVDDHLVCVGCGHVESANSSVLNHHPPRVQQRWRGIGRVDDHQECGQQAEVKEGIIHTSTFPPHHHHHHPHRHRGGWRIN